jgi:N utilization substance protein A
MFIDEQRPYAVAVFDDVDLPIAIGRNGQNIKLSSIICGYEIDAIKKTDHDLTNSIDILAIESLSDKFKSILIKNNINNTAEFISKDEVEL